MARNYTYFPGTSTGVQLGEQTGCTRNYYYDHAGRLISETISRTYYSADSTSESIVFLYDESGIIGMVRTVNGAANTYYFQRNLLGDVVAIFDTNGAMVAKYLYDAWGNCTISSESTNTAVAAANPIRYRGYYYDDDTGLYYCNARYYSPKWRRFISPDDTAYLDPESINGLNLYCYCNNDPVNYCDPSGSSAIVIGLIVGAIVGASIGFRTAAYMDYRDDGQIFNGSIAWYDYLGATLTGAAVGAAVGAGIGMAVSYSATGTLTASFTDIRFDFALKAAQNGNYSKLAKFATHNNSSNKVGLGKYIKGSPNSYEALSQKYGYTYFEMETKYWNKMAQALGGNVWNVNQAFLDQQLALGKTFVMLSNDYSGYYLQELLYLGLI